VLTGGGARGAYQAGALVAIAEILHANRLPFPIVAGSSAGSINAAYLAAHADNFIPATRQLADLWTGLEPNHVFRTDTPSIAKTAVQWAANLSLGGLTSGGARAKALLDTSPLRALLTRHLDPCAIHASVNRGDVHGLAITATSYATGLAVTFFEGAPATQPWTRANRCGIRSELALDHVLASAAIPIFFPAVMIENQWYADGSIRLSTPLSPAIRMGAERIVAITVRPESASSLSSLAGLATQHHALADCNPTESRDRATNNAPARTRYPTPAEAGGVLLDALFLDALELDAERTLRINHTLSTLGGSAPTPQSVALRNVELLVLRPSIDPALLVLHTLRHFPAPVRHMFRGLGASADRGWDLLSYLAFDGPFTTRLFQLGYDDTLHRADEIRAFCT